MKRNLLFLTGMILSKMAVVFAASPCVGRMYESKVPEMLRK